MSLAGKHRPGIAGSIPERKLKGRDTGLIHGSASLKQISRMRSANRIREKSR